MVRAFGLAAPLLGGLAAFGAAVGAVRWLLRLLTQREDSLRAFAWYRVGIGLVVVWLSATSLL